MENLSSPMSPNYVRVGVPEGGARLRIVGEGDAAYASAAGNRWRTGGNQYLEVNFNPLNGTSLYQDRDVDEGHGYVSSYDKAVHPDLPAPDPFRMTMVTPTLTEGFYTVSSRFTNWFWGPVQNWSVTVEVIDAGGNVITDELPECRFLRDGEMFGPNDSMPGQCAAQGTQGFPVDTRTGNEHMPLPGVGVAGRGPGLDFRLAYNSLDAAYDGPMGFGWRHSYDMQLLLNGDGSRTVVQETGAQVDFFPVTSPAGWRAAGRFDAELRDNGDGSWTFERGRCKFFTFDGTSGLLQSISDRNGYSTTLTHVGGLLTEVTDEAGRKLTFGYDANDRVDLITDPRTVGDGGARTITIGYSPAGDLTSYDDIGGGDWVMTYTNHLLETTRTPRHTDPAKVIENHYDGQGRVDWQEDELNRRTTFIYEDAEGGIAGATIVEDPDGDRRVDYYDEYGRRNKLTLGYGTADESTIEFGFDPVTSRVVRMTDGEGKLWRYEYDGVDLSKVIDPLGREALMTYNSFGQPLTVVDDEGVQTTYEYDATGNRRFATMADGSVDESVTEFIYGDPVNYPGDVTTVKDPLGESWLISHDPATGDVLSSTDPEGNVSTAEYNSIGWVKNTTAPLGNVTGGTPEDYRTHFEYTDYGDLRLTTNPLDETFEQFYDGNRNVYLTEDDQGEETFFTFTDTDELESVTTGYGTADATTISYTYHPDGARKSWTSGEGAVWNYTYDPVGRLFQEEDPDNNVTEYHYDRRHKLAEVVQPGGDCATPVGCITYGYDDAGQLTSVDYSDTATPDVTNFVYDGVGRRESATSDGLTWTWDWTDRGQLKSHTNGAGDIINYTWDAAGNLNTIDYPGAGAGIVDYDYDAASRVDSVTDWLNNVTTFDWDANSRLDLTTFPAATGNVDDYDYDRVGRLDEVTWTKGATTLGSIDYSRDPDGLINSATTTGLPTGPASFGYNARDQLTTLDAAASYDYDDAGNLTELPDGRLQVFDPSQQLCWSSPTATSGACATPPGDATVFDYADDRGNRTSMTDPDGTVSNYAYDQANRLTQADVTDATGDQFHPIDQTTVMDTQAGYATGKCPNTTAECLPFTDANGHLRTVQIAGEAGLPAAGEIEAVMLNVTVKNTVVAAGANAVLSVWPADVAWPWSTTLSFQDGDIVTNSVITRLDDLGRVNVVTSAGTDADVNISVQGYFTVADGSADGQFSAVDPTIIMHPNGTGDCQPVACGTLDLTNPYRDVKVLGVAGVPNDTDVSAVAVNVTTANSTGIGLLTVNATGAPGAFNFAYQPGEITSNLAIIPVGTDGRIRTSIFGNPTDAVVTIQGYFTGDPAANQGGFHPMSPELLVNAYTGNQVGACPNTAAECTPPTAFETRTIQVTGQGTIPTDNVDAVAVNITVDAATNGWLTAWDGQGATPSAITMTYDGGTITATAAIIPVDPATGQIKVTTAWADIEFRIDVHGYFASNDTITFDYDPNGLRTTKTGTHTGTTNYTWDQSGGLPLLLTETHNGNPTHIIYGPAGPIAELTDTETVAWYHHDNIGSTRLVTDNSGDPIGTYTYEPYGTLTDSTGTHEPILGYAGEYTDQETGLIYLRARYYDPTTAQYLTRDPLLNTTHEPYAYAANTPTNLTDPTGQCPMCIAVGVGIIVGGGIDILFQGTINSFHGCGFFDNIDWQQVGISALIGGATGGLARWWSITRLNPFSAAHLYDDGVRAVAPQSAIGFTDDAVASAYQGMRSGGGHASRHLVDAGLIPNSGSLSSRVALFEDLTSPILRSPTRTFDWRLGGTATRAFAGEAGGQRVVVFVAKEGPYQGRVLSAVVPDSTQVAQWGL